MICLDQNVNIETPKHTAKPAITNPKIPKSVVCVFQFDLKSVPGDYVLINQFSGFL